MDKNVETKGPKTDPEKYRAAIMALARMGSLSGIILLWFALSGLVYTLAEAKIEGSIEAGADFMYNLVLIKILARSGEISEQGVLTFATGIWAELFLILYFSWRASSGNGLISTILLAILIGIEIGAGFLYGYPDGIVVKFAWGGISVGLALFLGLGIFYSWKYRRLTREMAHRNAA